MCAAGRSGGFVSAPKHSNPGTLTEVRAMKKFQQTFKRSLLLAGASLLLTTACSDQQAPTPGKPVQTDKPVAESVRVVMGLPVSLNTVMVAMINQAADPLWVAAWHHPETDKEWRELERRAVQLELGGALLGIPGTGPKDQEWTSNEQWKMWSGQIRDVGADAVVAVKARDLDAISKVGDRIVEICEGCHIDFKPALPTGGEFGELSPTAKDFEKD